MTRPSDRAALVDALVAQVRAIGGAPAPYLDEFTPLFRRQTLDKGEYFAHTQIAASGQRFLPIEDHGAIAIEVRYSRVVRAIDRFDGGSVVAVVPRLILMGTGVYDEAAIAIDAAGARREHFFDRASGVR